jgi:uncharacterized RDD family membrane protein YckC
MSATPLAYAGFWRRVAAFLLDCFIVFVPVQYLLLILVSLELESAGVWLSLADVAIWWAYKAGMESSGLQATLGKKAMSIKVCDLDGQRISFARASGRFVAWFISAMLFGIGYLVAAFTPKRQALHDIIASTLVVKADPFRPTS